MSGRVGSNQTECRRIEIRGAVQGVGFRPFVYRLARELSLAGWVNNSPQGVLIEIEGARARVTEFIDRLHTDLPPRASIHSLVHDLTGCRGYTQFEIRASAQSGAKSAVVLPDIATCGACRAEIFDPNNRRYLYPFTNCTNCGPRFSIIEALPYDRPNTTMRSFTMCADCRAEYENPLDRRFHAQPNACHQCGPQLLLWGPDRDVLAARHDALLSAAAALLEGKIVAVKGLGGFHLMVLAADDVAVQRLRKLKGREEKPLALMYPSLDAVRQDCRVSDLEERLLLSPEAPIVILQRLNGSTDRIADSVAPRNPNLGIMLPYTPLHHLLMQRLRAPVVATSGNLSEEPICTDEQEAVGRLGRIADLFLVHDRPISRHVDDSIVREVLGREMVLRRARGFAPLPVQMPESLPPLLAVGGHLKNTIAVAVGQDVFVSQHIGDLETQETCTAFTSAIEKFKSFYEVQPESVACDLHPDYLSTAYARRTGLPVVPVQHHYAHVAGCMAENSLQPPLLGVAWDGTGYGTDGTIWGGEFLNVNEQDFERYAHFRTFRLPGGEAAIREPRRAALGLLYEIHGEDLFSMTDLATLAAFTPAELQVMRGVLARKLNAPLTSSAGRLFDGVASLLNLRQQNRFEGQAAMELEFAIGSVESDESYAFELVSVGDSGVVVDWGPMMKQIIQDLRGSRGSAEISLRFHNTLAEIIVAVARRAGEVQVVLSGGCFQNRYLLERAVRRLEAAGFRVYWNRLTPPNDGGVAVGQAVAAARALRKG